MTLEEKTRIFGQFLFCHVKSGNTTIQMQSIDGNTGCVSSLGNVVQLPIEECKLILRDIKKITRKDAIQCACLGNLPSALVKNWQVQQNYYGETILSWPGEDINYKNMVVFKDDRLNCYQVDYLRSHGYAIGIPKECYVLEDK